MCFLTAIVVFCFWPAPPMARASEIEIDGGAYQTPTRAVKASDYPVFSDDLDLSGMLTAIDRQLARFAQKKLTGTLRMGRKVYPLSKARDSLVAFRALIVTFNSCARREAKARCYQDLNQAIRSRFDLYVPDLKPSDPRYGQDDFAFFTGYHTHSIEARESRQGAFTHPIYANPRDSRLNGKTRLQIDFLGALDGRGLEIAYAKQLFDIYLMHVAGSGKLTIRAPNGAVKRYFLQYDGTNRQRWQFISLYMAKKGYITNGSIPAQRRFLNAHPELQREIFSQCPSYVYLKPTDQPPKGSDSVAVTDGRSLATDLKSYPFKGLLTYVQSRRPVDTGHYDMEEDDKAKIPFQSFSRFFLDQDTGGAIDGKARADIYFGSDDYAFFSAMHEEELGKIHYLMLK
jgi:membrane-bound lytic murein transglycosylase A